MTLQELLTAHLGTIHDVETQLVEYNEDELKLENKNELIPPTYNIYFESADNGEILGGHIMLSEKLFNEIKDSLDFPTPVMKPREHNA